MAEKPHKSGGMRKCATAFRQPVVYLASEFRTTKNSKSKFCKDWCRKPAPKIHLHVVECRMFAQLLFVGQLVARGDTARDSGAAGYAFPHDESKGIDVNAQKSVAVKRNRPLQNLWSHVATRSDLAMPLKNLAKIKTKIKN